MRLPTLLRQLALSLVFAAAPSWAGTLLVWGDSLSAGYGLRAQDAWPSLLERKLNESGKPPLKVVNASISGETTAGGRSRLAAALQMHRPSLVIIELGANDGLRGLPIPAMQANLQAMIEASREAGAKVLLVGMRMPPNYGPDYTARFEKTYRELARIHKVRLVPFMMQGFADKRDYFQADGIHPTAAAQPLILESIWRELKPLLH